MKAKELTAERVKLGYSMQDMANQMKIAKSTYARYEDETAVVPAEIATKLSAIKKSNKAFFAGMDKRIAENLPGGVCPNLLRIK